MISPLVNETHSLAQFECSALAVFDLDGTLVTRDSFLPFLTKYTIKRRRFWPLLVMPFWIALYVARLISARTVKERLLVAFFGGESKESIEHFADHFCTTWVETHLRPTLMEKLREHQAAGHRVILLSASPDIYVPKIGKFLGIPETVCTRVAWNGSTCAGTIIGPNCKGNEKVTLLREFLKVNDLPVPCYAYGDSQSDLPLLRQVTHGFLVKADTLQDMSSAKN